MTEEWIMNLLSIAACVVAGASVINQMTPDADRHPKFAAWIDYLSLNVHKAQNNPHNHPWTKMMMKPCDTPIECGEDCPGEEIEIKDERPRRREAILATKRKKELHNAQTT